MADFRLSAKIIKRSNGQSAVAAAAYRSASRFEDLRTGKTHDYTRKSGVVHTEILAPEQTPDRMFDRAELWNAVEKLETYKNAQVSREVQLSLPHELTAEQRLTLVRDFVQEQFVDRGMIADIAIHDPDKQSDQRNYHAHVMLTMREVTADGLGRKNIPVLDPETGEPKRRKNNKIVYEPSIKVDEDLILEWREKWAHHQNRELERHGHAERVDHRSYEERGIDKEPQQHMGQKATEMERRGEVSRIGEKNRKIEFNNATRLKTRALQAVLSAQVSLQKAQMNTWANEQRQSLKERLRDSQIDLHVKHRQERDQLKATQKRDNDGLRRDISSQVKTITTRVQSAKGAKKLLRNLLGRTKADRATLNELQKALQAVRVSEQVQRVDLQRKQQTERDIQHEREQEESQKLERSIDSKQDHELSFKDRLRAEYRRSTREERKATREQKEERQEGIERKPN